MIKVAKQVIEQGNFPDGSLLVKANTGWAYATAADGNAVLVEWYYENDAELFTLICLRKHFGDIPMALFMPYCPHARMDRVKEMNDVFTLKYFAEVINSLNFDAVLCEDIHSNVAAALINNFYHIDREYLNVKGLYDHLSFDASNEMIVCYPDEGAMKRYSDAIGVPYAFGIKKRDWKTGKILGLDLMNRELVEGKDVLIVDDICSKGGTFFYTAKALKEAGAKNIYLFVTHCEKTILDGELINSGLVEAIYTTDSICPKDLHPLIHFVTNYRQEEGNDDF